MSMEAEIAVLRADLARTYELLTGVINTLAAQVAASRAVHDLLDAEGVLSRHQLCEQALAYAERAGLGPEVVAVMSSILAPTPTASASAGLYH